MADLVGQTLLGRYRIDEFLGRGGMAEVYRAWDAERSVYVALKVLNEDLAEDYVFVRRFAREARALELLQHPHIVRFFGFEEAGSLAFLVMEYIDGVTLRRQLRLLGRSLALPEALAVLQPVCSALHYAHEMGIYHCDVKPANIFIERGGRVVLGDFGIARLSESVTVTFSTPGTPAYMAPEQCRGEELDARTDIYGLGVTTYEMLTLDRPFKGDTDGTTGSRGERVWWEQMQVPPPRPGSVNPKIPAAAEAAILRALEKGSARRQQRVLEFYEELSSGEAVQPATMLPQIVEPPLSAVSPDSMQGSRIRQLLGGLGNRTVVAAGIGMVLLAVLVLALIGLLLAGGGNLSATPVTQLTTDTQTAIAQSTATPRLPAAAPAAVALPQIAAKSGNPGATVTYTLRVTNTGSMSDTFNVDSNYNWTTATTPITIGPLAIGASTKVVVTVTIPTSAADGDTDTVTIILTSQEDNTQLAVCTLTTMTKWHSLFLPLVLKGYRQ